MEPTHTQQFALKWNNFHSNLSSGFHELFEAAEMVDVTLAVDGKFLQAHKIVLSICSPYFREMFKVNPCKHPIVILKDVGHEHMKDILEFMYLGEVSVLRENLTSFLRTAELLQVKGLTGDDSNESSSKEDEKIDCDNDDEEDYTNLMHNIQYNQQFSSMDNHLPIPQHFPLPTTIPKIQSPPPPPLPIPQLSQISNIPQSVNNKRYSKSSNGNGKRSKIDNNANQNILNKSITTPMIKNEEEITNQNKKNVNPNHDNEILNEYDKTNVKTEKGPVEEECSETNEKNVRTFENFIDQGKPEMKLAVKQTYVCEKCPKKFTRRDHLRTHEKNIHGEDAGPFVCVVCAQLYKNTESLRKHISKFHMVVNSVGAPVDLVRT